MTTLHVCLAVTDADRSVEWYESNLGFEYAWEFTMGDTRHVYIADENGFELQLSDTDGETSLEPGTAWDHLAISVDDVEAAVERINHHGLEKAPFVVEPAGARVAFIEDPDGHLIELLEPLED